jgi:hypothetical protein
MPKEARNPKYEQGLHIHNVRASEFGFVLGASGFIGSNLVHELAAQEHRVKVLLRPTAKVLTQGPC